jgi:para-aminobenzoate synthetase component I
MNILQPDVRFISTGSVTHCNYLWERSRFEWRLNDRKDPAETMAAFLGSYGLGRLRASDGMPPFTQREHALSEICGAAVFVSAAGAAAMIGAPTGALTPIPAIPDVVAIVYAHADSDHAPPGRQAVPAERPWHLGEWQSSWTSAEHAAAVQAVRASIARGDVYQVNVVGHASAPYLGDPLPALRRVTALPGAQYPGILTGQGWALACASPETLIRVRDGMVETRPIKGTRPATAAGRAELLASTKERAEHIMIVDLERNDLARVAATGTVTVPELFGVRRWCDLWQAESQVTARLADGVDLATLLAAVCPGGSVTGAPKLAALDRIAALEPVGRGPSMGAIGWIAADRLDLGLTIRTVAVDSERVHVWAGGGITWDSDPAAEVAEAAAKADPLKTALNP